MAKPLPLPAPTSLISWHVSLSGDEFDVEGVSVVDALKLFTAWNDKRAGSGFTPAQLAELVKRSARTAQRAEAAAAALEALDAETPNR